MGQSREVSDPGMSSGREAPEMSWHKALPARPSPPEVVAFCDRYAPNLPDVMAAWPVIKPAVVAAVLTTRPQTLKPAANLLSIGGKFAAWSHRRTGLDPERLWTPRNVNAWAETLPASRAGSHAAKVARIGRACTTRAPWPPPPASFAHRYRTYYTNEQVARYVAAVPLQRSEISRRRYEVVLAVCRGCGLKTAEMKAVAATDFATVDGVPVVRVPGPKPRTVPVDPEWVDRLEDLCARYPEGPLIGPTGDYTNWFGNVAAKFAVDVTGTPVSAFTLRNTWLLATARRSRVSLADLLAVAGLTSVHPLQDLLPLLEPSDETTLLGHLRGEYP